MHVPSPDYELQIIKEIFQPTYITTYNKCKAINCEQPLNYGYFLCQDNINLVKKQKLSKYDYIVAIENIIDLLTIHTDHYYIQTCYVIIEDNKGIQYRGVSFGIPIHKRDLQPNQLTRPDEMEEMDEREGQISRKDQIRSALRDCLKYFNHILAP